MSYWAVAQTVTKMEHLVRRDIEKTNHGAFLPTYARHWKIDGRPYVKEYPLMGGYVFFLTEADDWAGIPDIHGVYDVLANPDRSPKRVTELEMARLVMGHAKGIHNRTDPAKFTKYYRPAPTRKRNSRKPRPGNRLRNFAAA
jgi:transcription antitermination factor NusG